MNHQDEFNYNRIARAIEYIHQHYKKQPHLEDIAGHLHLSTYHFQRLFIEWAGVSPKKFLQYISIQHAKRMLKNEGSTLFDTAHETGLSGTGRLHDLFVTIEGMTPGEYKNGGEHLSINYTFSSSPFGRLLVASTGKGVCYMTFIDDEREALTDLSRHFPNARLTQKNDQLQKNALQLFEQEWSDAGQVKLHLKGTPFQLKVWEALLTIPMGQLSTYSSLATQIGKPTKASRAIGSAIGKNPVAFIIPCHRVLQSSGLISGYKWGTTRKTAIIGWEAAKIEANQKEFIDEY